MKNATVNESLNAICPYYTMYPLEFPKRALRGIRTNDAWVFDPFCGRGTTNFAARLAGIPSIGFDSSPIATAIASAKLAASTPKKINNAVFDVLARCPSPATIPTGEFWAHAYHEETLQEICRLREGLLLRCETSEEVLLRAIILGALHGPQTKQAPSYFSNQCPRTFAPKPNYAVRFWRKHGLRPRRVGLLELIERRAKRYLESCPAENGGYIRTCDSRDGRSFWFKEKVDAIITSPPYYGMRTYIPDQWIRNWFVGGPSKVEYSQPTSEISHQSPSEFSKQLGAVWKNCAKVAKDGCRLSIRFGGINDRCHDPLVIIKDSLRDSGWRIVTARSAGDANRGKRQATQFGRRISSSPRVEYDIYARLL